MILYDWQRGRLPFFVCPPFGETPKAGERGVSKKKPSLAAAETEEEKEQKEALTQLVRQRFSKIRITADFNKEDQTNPTGEEEEEEDETESIIDYDELLQAKEEAGEEDEDSDDDVM